MSKFKGGCLCGSLRYEIDADPAFSAICHCTHCRRQSGSAFSMVAGFPADSVKIEGDTLKAYNDAGESGLQLLRQFCERCGTSLFSEAQVLPGLLLVKTGTLDQPDAIPMGMEIWCRSKLSAETLGDQLPQFEGNPS